MKMREAIELANSLKNETAESGTVTQYSHVEGKKHWPELENLEFRREIETLMYRVDKSVVQVYFTTPDENKVGWAIHVVKVEAENGISDGNEPAED